MTVRFGLGSRVGLGVRAGAAFSWTPAALSSAIAWWRSDLGVTYDGSSRVSAWADQVAAYDYAQATGSYQPLYSATGGPNSMPYVRLDDVNRYMDVAMALPAPGTTPTCIWLVGRRTTDVGSKWIVGSSPVNKRLVYQVAVGDQLATYDGSVAATNTGMGTNVWGRIYAEFSNSTSDRLKCRATNTTGNAGNSASETKRTLGGSSTLSSLFDFCEVLYLNAKLSAPDEALLDAYATARYGAGLV